MRITTAFLVVASESIRLEHELLADIKLHLTVAIALSKAYREVDNSIYWNDASVATKKRVKERLNRLAFDVKSSILDALEAHDSYCDLMGEKSCSTWFKKMSYDIKKALQVLNKEHGHETDYIQLKLIK